MNENLRFGLIIAVFVLLAGLLWFALSGGEPEPEAEVSVRPVARVEEELEPFDEVSLPSLGTSRVRSTP